MIFFLKKFKNLNYKDKHLFIKKLNNLKINNVSRGILALRSQSIIIYYSIFKGNLNDVW